MPENEKRYELRFNKSDIDLPALLSGSPLSDRAPDHLEIRMSEDEFNALGAPQRMTHYMFTRGTSYEGHATTVPAREAIAAKSGATAHSKTINALRAKGGLPELPSEEVYRVAHSLDTIGADALQFLLGLHEDWREPAFEPEHDEVVRLAQARGLALSDFCI